MKNILLIENNYQTIAQVLNALKNEEYFVDVAETSAKGYQMALKNWPKLIICSKTLYDTPGNEILYKLKDESYISTIPFVYLLDKNSSKVTKRESHFDLDFYVVKPFTTKELLRIVDLALERYKDLIEKSEKKLNQLRGSISYSLPHEFFTPLNGILGFTDILIKEYNNLSKEEIMQMLGYINSDAIRLKKITENFLVFSQLEMISKDAEKIEALRKTYFIDVKEIIFSTACEIAKKYKRDDDLIFEMDKCVVRMNESYMKNMIQELIDNAFKFSKKGSAVIINIMSNNTSIMLSVTDQGRGMTSDQIASIGAYMQFERDLYEQQGSGLGLTIAKKIAELHGGHFNVESTVNEGTKVTIIFDN